MKVKYRILYTILLAFLALCLSACSRDKDRALEEGEYYIYYLNASATELTKLPYKATGSSKEELVDELMEAMMNVPSDEEVLSAIEDKVSYEKHELRDDVLYLYFDVNYNSMKAEREILARRAMAQTLEQISGVNFIGIYVAEQPFMDVAGETVLLFSSKDFVDGIGDLNAYDKIKLKLYFSSDTGDKLIEESRELFYNVNTPIEKLILEQLILGPRTSSLKATLPSDTGIVSIYTDDNVCYVNFDEAFLNANQGIKEEVAIYSVVNSLLELNTINKVKIMVNGSDDIRYKDVLSLDTLFERNLDYFVE